MKTKIVNVYHPQNEGETYDTQIPEDLFEAFLSLKEDLSKKSNGKYSCTPFMFDPKTLGVYSAVLEHDGKTIKTEYIIHLTKRQNNS